MFLGNNNNKNKSNNEKMAKNMMNERRVRTVGANENDEKMANEIGTGIEIRKRRTIEKYVHILLPIYEDDDGEGEKRELGARRGKENQGVSFKPVLGNSD